MKVFNVFFISNIVTALFSTPFKGTLNRKQLPQRRLRDYGAWLLTRKTRVQYQPRQSHSDRGKILEARPVARTKTPILIIFGKNTYIWGGGAPSAPSSSPPPPATGLLEAHVVCDVCAL